MMSPTAIHPLKILAAVGAAFLVWGLVLAYASSPAQAATITVNSTDDVAANDGECTLREAITSANTNTASGGCVAGSGDDTIIFALPPEDAPWTVNLTGLLPVLSSNIAIEGPGEGKLTVRRSDTAGLNSRIFTVAGSTAGQQNEVSISEITIANGNLLVGGGILVRGPTSTVPAPNVTINSSTISGNHTPIRGQGGGIDNFGTLTITNSTVSGNSASFGGGIYNERGSTLTVNDSTISENSGGLSGGFGGGIVNFGTASRPSMLT